jgi:4-carboxymuconolactone decarboxylase
MTTTADAEDRFPPIPESQMTERQRAAVAAFRAARHAELSGPFVPLVRSPALLDRTRALGEYLRFESPLPARLRELAILLTARRWSQNYEWDHHAPLALEAGLRPETMAAIQADERPEEMTDEEAVVYAFCDELHRLQTVSDPTYARALALFGEEGLVDLVGMNGYYTLLAMVLNVARTPVPDGRPEALSRITR